MIQSPRGGVSVSPVLGHATVDRLSLQPFGDAVATTLLSPLRFALLASRTESSPSTDSSYACVFDTVQSAASLFLLSTHESTVHNWLRSVFKQNLALSLSSTVEPRKDRGRQRSLSQSTVSTCDTWPDSDGYSEKKFVSDCLEFFTVARDEYFSQHWDAVDMLVAANNTRLHDVLCKAKGTHSPGRLDVQVPKDWGTDYQLTDGNAMSILRPGVDDAWVLIAFFTPLDPMCAELRPRFREAAKSLRGVVMTAAASAQAAHHLVTRSNVTSFPTVKLFRGGRDILTITDNTVEGIVERVTTATTTAMFPHCDHRRRVRQRWRHVANMVRLAQQRSCLETQRRFTTLRAQLHSLRSSAPLDESREHPPLIVFLGGGMGAGKSTVAAEMRRSPFWQQHGADVVVIEADAIKMSDPIFQALTKFGESSASEEVHSHSVRAAEEIFVTAVGDRRDIVFDGTLQWAPFVVQTVEMIRDTRHLYRRGPGYQVHADGSVTEQYWERYAEVDAPLRPYRVELVGVTIDPAVAVRRGLTRRILTERGVPVRGQLASHRAFAQHLPLYESLFDAVTVYDNTDGPTVIARKDAPTDPLTVIRPGLYEAFLRQAGLHVLAHSAAELYGAPPPPPPMVMDSAENTPTGVTAGSETWKDDDSDASGESDGASNCSGAEPADAGMSPRSEGSAGQRVDPDAQRLQRRYEELRQRNMLPLPSMGLPKLLAKYSSQEEWASRLRSFWADGATMLSEGEVSPLQSPSLATSWASSMSSVSVRSFSGGSSRSRRSLSGDSRSSRAHSGGSTDFSAVAASASVSIALGAGVPRAHAAAARWRDVDGSDTLGRTLRTRRASLQKPARASVSATAAVDAATSGLGVVAVRGRSLAPHQHLEPVGGIGLTVTLAVDES